MNVFLSQIAFPLIAAVTQVYPPLTLYIKNKNKRGTFSPSNDIKSATTIPTCVTSLGDATEFYDGGRPLIA